MSQVITYPPGLKAAAAELGVQLPKTEKFDARDALLELSEDFQNATIHGEDCDADFGGFSFKKLARGVGKGFKGAGKGIVKGIKKVASNPIVQVLNPAVAIGIHTTDKALGGKGVIKGPLGKIVDAGTAAATTVVPVSKLAHGPMAQLGKKFGSSAAKIAAKAVGHTGITAGHAVAFAIPSKNIPIKQAMAGADKLLGDPNVKNSAAVVRNTRALAALGDPAARRGLAVLHAVGHVRLAQSTPPGKKAIPTPLAVHPAALTVKRSPVQVRQLAKKKVAASPKKTLWQKVVAWFKA